jgi:D-lactate dehydrogenase
VNSRVDKKVFSRLPNLKFIATRSTGFDHIDIAQAEKQNILVSNVPSYGENTVAEFTFALILALSRKIYPAIKRVHEQGLFSYEGLRGFDLKGKTIGVIGTGKIGARVIKIAQGFEMEVLAYDPHPREDLGIKYATLEDLLKKSDIISIHVPYMPATHHLINEENLKLVKPTAILINTSRGGLVDTMALLTSLKQKQLAGAGLDVLEEEGYIIDELNLLKGHPNEEQLKTILADHELMQMDNVVVTPHNAFNTKEALERIFQTTAENIKSFQLKLPVNLVNLKYLISFTLSTCGPRHKSVKSP